MHLLVTGGGRGIGAATCRLAGARGWAATINYRAERIGAGAPLGRPGSAEEVADAVLRLLSDRASYTSGAILTSPADAESRPERDARAVL